ncbi:family 43 glycosylhydrolase [Marinimicrobium sp. C2-29]|uniref:family 43 glycosylhydrolase n=1 Tax=Marinimicrobium sp. C2-29 TaxID=3139825 RepID=UPI003139260F
MRLSKQRILAVLLLLGGYFLPLSVHAINLYHEDQMHDPSSIEEDNGVYWTFGTGEGIAAKRSTDLVSWEIAEPVFPGGNWPAWIDEQSPNFDGTFWAPDLIQFEGQYWLYYTVPCGTTGCNTTAIGVASTPSLNDPNWTDHGMVVSDDTEPLTDAGEKIGSIDAGLLKDANGGIWMAYGTHFGGIHLRPIDPATGKRLNEDRWGIIGNNGEWNEFEAAAVEYINGYYYAFATLGACCDGKDSSYHIVMGRSTNPTGPYLDKNGRDMWDYGGTPVLVTEGNKLAPGHYGYFNHYGQNIVSLHYYDGTTESGWPARVDLREMSFDADGWPVFTQDFTIAGAGAPTPVNANLADGGTYTITAKHSGKPLETRSTRGSCTALSDGNNVAQASDDGSACQQWVVRRARDKNGNATDYTQHYWTLHPAGDPGFAMDNVNFAIQDGNNIQIWSAASVEAQQFRLVDQGNGYYEILNRASSKPMNVADSSTADGANVEQWRSQGWDSQQFVFTQVSGGDTTAPAAPTELSATAGDGEIRLDWADNSEADMGSYNVYRSATSGSGYALVETGIEESRYVDRKLTNGTPYYYVVKAADSGYNLSASSSETSATPQALGPRLIAHYEFEGNADDTLGFHHGSTVGSPAYTTGRIGQAIDLDGTDDVVNLSPEAPHLTDITIATWVHWDGGMDWQRVFDFGHDVDRYFMMTPSSSSGTLRFGITLHGPAEEQIVETSALPTGQWVHLAITLGDDTARLYVDGVEVASNHSVTNDPVDILPVDNQVGQSQFDDPLLDGRLDDLRIYNYALSSTEVAALHSGDSDGGGDTGDATTMSADSIVLSTVSSGKGNKRGQAVVTVLDNTGSAVEGATVTGTFSGGFSETASADADANGQATLTTTGTKKGNVSFSFCVDDIAGALTYDSNQNVATCSSL